MQAADWICRQLRTHASLQEHPEGRLWLAVTTDAVCCVLNPSARKDFGEGRKEQALSWLMGAAFEGIAEILDLDVDWCREAVRAAMRWTDEQRETRQPLANVVGEEG